MRDPFKKTLSKIKIEDAHGGTGKRQLILSKNDAISKHLHAMTKGFLAPASVFNWHKHEGIDEFFIVLKGTGIIKFENGKKIKYNKCDLIYTPANIAHRIENTSKERDEFFFIRIDS